MLVSGIKKEKVEVTLNNDTLTFIIRQLINEHVLGFEKGSRNGNLNYSISNDGWLGIWEDDGSYHNSKDEFRKIRQASELDKAACQIIQLVRKGLFSTKKKD